MTNTNQVNMLLMLDAAQIAQLIPHHGSMSLLDAVIAYDAKHIHCSAVSHNQPTNPLRENGVLHAVCGVEYAAQAMAVHGSLSNFKNQAFAPRGGRLASVRSVDFFTARLDDIKITIDITATLIVSDENTMMYEFVLTANTRLLLQGKATVVLMPLQNG